MTIYRIVFRNQIQKNILGIFDNHDEAILSMNSLLTEDENNYKIWFGDNTALNSLDSDEINKIKNIMYTGQISIEEIEY